MRLHALRQFALAQPATTVVKQWGEHLVFKVAGKVFFLISIDGDTVEAVTFKIPRPEFEGLIEIDGITQAPYFAKRHWVRVGDISALPKAQLEAHIRRSYELVRCGLPKKIQAALE
jgi:predicted DNA-binding protein (MmcQ/YjbR family)